MTTPRKTALGLCAALSLSLTAACSSGGNNSTGAAGSGGSAGGASGGSGGGGGSAGGASGGTGGAAGAGPGDAGTDATTTCNTSPGKALRFSGTMVDLMTGDLGTDLPGGDVPRTIEVWVKYLGAQSWTAEHTIMETGKAMGGQNRVLGLDNSGYSGTTAQFGPYTNGYSDNNNPNGVFVPNIPQMGWLHLGWSYTGNHGTLSFTVNGTEHAIMTQAGTPTLNLFQGIVTLGASQNFGTQGFDGLLDEVRIWSIARAPAEIAGDMNVVLKGTEPGLAAYYRLDEGTGTVADDVTGNPAHRLSVCTATSATCPAANQVNPMWVDSDLPGPLTCAP